MGVSIGAAMGLAAALTFLLGASFRLGRMGSLGFQWGLAAALWWVVLGRSPLPSDLAFGILEPALLMTGLVGVLLTAQRWRWMAVSWLLLGVTGLGAAVVTVGSQAGGVAQAQRLQVGIWSVIPLVVAAVVAVLMYRAWLAWQGSVAIALVLALGLALTLDSGLYGWLSGGLEAGWGPWGQALLAKVLTKGAIALGGAGPIGWWYLRSSSLLPEEASTDI